MSNISSRLCIALLTYSTKPRGGVVHTLSLAEALVQLGHQVSIWTLGREGDVAFFRPVDPRVRIHVVPFTNYDDETVGQKIIRSIEVLSSHFRTYYYSSHPYDIIHAQDCISANAICQIPTLNCIRTIHHLDSFTTPELITCHEKAITLPEARICVSHVVAQQVYDQWGYTPQVIPNGVDATRFACAVNDTFAREQWHQKLGKYILAMGGIEPRKGSLDLIESYAYLHEHYPHYRDISLVIAGGETLFDYRPYRQQWEQRALELEITPIILGNIDENNLPSLIAQAQLLAFLSTNEGFGLAALEALAAQTPVVARDLPVLREIFSSTLSYGHDIASFADAMHRILSDRNNNNNILAQGLALSQQYTWNTTATLHEKFYHKIISLRT